MNNEAINNVKALFAEQDRSKRTLHLTANENIMSKTARSFLSSNFSYRYYAGNYYQNGQKNASCCIVKGLMMRNFPALCELEERARECMNSMFHANYCDFKPLSGVHAVFCIISAVSKPGDRVCIFTGQSVGHHATVPILHHLGRKISYFPWSFENFDIDLERFKQEVRVNKPDLVYFDYGTPLYSLPIRKIRDIVGQETMMIYDGSHVLGLIAGGKFQDPLKEGCNILAGNTHKTFFGPQKAVLLYRDSDLGLKIADQLFEHAVSSQHAHHAVALYITAMEMMTHGREYAEQIISNSHALSRALSSAGFGLIKRCDRYSDSHLIAISGPFPEGNHAACRRLHECGISTNSRNIFGVEALRIGVQEITRRGMKENNMEEIARFFKRTVLDMEDAHSVSKEVDEFNQRFEGIKYTLDEHFNITD